MKNYRIIPFILLALSACACSPSSVNNDKPDEETPIEDDLPTEYSPYLFLSEMNVGSPYQNRSVEIANISDQDISLNGYSINIYRNAVETPTENISLNNYTIKANSCFVVAYSNARAEILDKADLVSDKFLTDGSFPISLSYKNIAFDSIGIIGYFNNSLQGAALVRLKEHFNQTLDFKAVNWARYPINSLDTLGNIDVISQSDLEAGPKLTQKDLDTPFCTNASKGDGGAYKVKYIRNIDGDTSVFDYGSTYSSYGVNGTLSTRYYGINTPEIAHSAGETSDPYGDVAKAFTTNQLKNAKNYIVQSVNGYTFHETYGRMLGYIWIANVSNPKPEDYVLLNFLILKNGFAHSAFINRKEEYHSLMTYKGVSFLEYICYAEEYAQEHQLNVFSK